LIGALGWGLLLVSFALVWAHSWHDQSARLFCLQACGTEAFSANGFLMLIIRGCGSTKALSTLLTLRISAGLSHSLSSNLAMGLDPIN